MSHMPNFWQPSRLSTRIPEEGDVGRQTLRPFNISRSNVGGIDRERSEFKTNSEDSHSVTPFLAAGMQRDYQNRHLQERTHLVLQGGDALYHTADAVPHLYTLNAQNIPVPQPHRYMPGISQTDADAEPMNFGPRKSRVRGGVPETRDSLGHYGYMQGNQGIHRDRYHGAQGKGR